MDKGKIIEVELSRWNPSGVNPSAEITLPATPYELADAFEKARITGDTVYSTEVLSCQLDYLPQFIAPDTNLYELNHLAGRLASLSAWETDCFEGMVMMDAIQLKYAPIPVERLINMTHSMAHCQIAYEAHDDQSLGKFYADNDFVPELETLSKKIFPWLDYAKIGREMREGEGGVFTPCGYVVQNGEVSAQYHSGDAVPLENPDYAVLLRVTKGYFNTPAQDDAPAVYLKLSAEDAAFHQAMDAIGAASPEECVFSAEDCMAPFLTEKINDALYASEGDCYGLVNELSRQLRQIDTENRLLTYKAMLEEAPGDVSLEEALDLMPMAAEFELLADTVSASEYAKKEIQQMLSFASDQGLHKFCDLDSYGRYLLKQRGAVETAYGFLTPHNGMTVEQYLNRPDQSFGMEMK